MSLGLMPSCDEQGCSAAWVRHHAGLGPDQ